MDTGIYNAVPYTLTRKPVEGLRIRGVVLDYLSLLKPRVVLLHLFTATVSMFLAARGVPPFGKLAFVLTGGGLTAGAAGALNCYFDRDIDSRMSRTRNRPLPGGRVPAKRAFIFGAACALVGLSLLLRLSNYAALLALAAMASYIVVYTLWLKRSTGLSAIFSSGIGAVPPLIGWISVTGHLSITPFVLFLIIALWTPPHFWSLALARRNEYTNAGLSVVPRKTSEFWLCGFVVLLVATSLSLFPLAHPGTIYIAVVAFMGTVYVILSASFVRTRSISAAHRLYIYSIIYLPLLFAAMLAGILF